MKVFAVLLLLGLFALAQCYYDHTDNYDTTDRGVEPNPCTGMEQAALKYLKYEKIIFKILPASALKKVMMTLGEQVVNHINATLPIFSLFNSHADPNHFAKRSIDTLIEELESGDYDKLQSLLGQTKRHFGFLLRLWKRQSPESIRRMLLSSIREQSEVIEWHARRCQQPGTPEPTDWYPQTTDWYPQTTDGYPRTTDWYPQTTDWNPETTDWHSQTTDWYPQTTGGISNVIKGIRVWVNVTGLGLEPIYPHHLGGNTNITGRVEVLVHGRWGTICDDIWGNQNARVACRQMGFRNGIAAYYHSSGTGSIWMDNVNCHGWEKSLEECRHNGWGNHNCRHNEDAAIQCWM